jgi:hypothetical protein
MNIVATILTTKKAPMFVLTMPAMKGFNSVAPEYRTPITVVKQSMEPMKIRRKHGITSVFSMGRLLLSLQNTDLVQVFMNKLINLDIFQIDKQVLHR